MLEVSVRRRSKPCSMFSIPAVYCILTRVSLLGRTLVFTLFLILRAGSCDLPFLVIPSWMFKPRMKTYLLQIVSQGLTEKQNKNKTKLLKNMPACTKSIYLKLNHKTLLFRFTDVIVTYVHYEFIMRAQNRWCWLKMTCTASDAGPYGGCCCPWRHQRRGWWSAEKPWGWSGLPVARTGAAGHWAIFGRILEQNLELVLYLSQPSWCPKVYPSSQSNRIWGLILPELAWVLEETGRAPIWCQRPLTVGGVVFSHVPHAWVICLVWWTWPDSSSELTSPPSVNMQLFLLYPSLGGGWGTDLSSLMY